MPQKKTVKPPVVEMKGSEFAALVRPMLKFVCTDRYSSIPVLGAVRLHSHGGYLVATATDRYIVGFHRRLCSAPDGIEVMVSAQSIQHILTVFKATRASDPDLTITFHTDRIAFSVPTLTEALAGELSWPLVPGEYPKVVGSIMAKKPDLASPITALSPALVAKFAHVPSEGQPMVISVQQNGPTFVRIGDDFVGAVMAVRFDGSPSDDLTQGWDGFLGPGEGAKVEEVTA